MKASELKIGNYVNAPTLTDTFYIEVFRLCEGEVNEFDESEISPIPLDAEWLERCGLSQGYDWLYRQPKGLYTIPCGEDSLLFNLESGLHYEKEIGDVSFSLSLTKVQYLHQLQNLYFALTGTELKIEI